MRPGKFFNQARAPLAPRMFAIILSCSPRQTIPFTLSSHFISYSVQSLTRHSPRQRFGLRCVFPRGFHKLLSCWDFHSNHLWRCHVGSCDKKTKNGRSIWSIAGRASYPENGGKQTVSVWTLISGFKSWIVASLFSQRRQSEHPTG